MRKYIVFTLLLVFPMFVQAEECTDEMIKEYEQSAAKIVITPTRLDNSNTFEIWVKGVTNGLVVEHGRTVLDEGFLGYAQAGDNYTARVYVGYGACNGTTIKEVKVNLPEKIEQCGDDCDKEEDVTPPTVVEKPTTNTEVEKPTVNTQQKPNNNSSTTKEENTTSNKKDETVVDKPSIDQEQTPTIDKDNDKDKEETEIKDETSNNNEDIIDNNTNSDDNVETEKDEEKEEQTEKNGPIENNNYTRDIIIFTSFSFLAIIFYIIIKNNKIKLSK